MTSKATATKAPSTKVTSADVAALAGVHRSSVSAVLNGASTNTGVSQATRERILKAAAELNYVPDSHAQRLAGGRDRRLLALLIPEMDFDVATRKSKAIQTALSEQGFNVPLHALEEFSTIRHQEFIADLRRQRPRAIICHTRGLQSEAVTELRHYQEEGGILICFDDPFEIDCDQVIFDREDNTYQAAHHLLALGHREIGLWMSGSSDDVLSRPLTSFRLDGFRRALGEFGLSIRPEWLLQSGHFSRNEESGAELAAHLLQMAHRPTGMCIVNDYAAQACIAELGRGGLRVPQDISIVGLDDLPIARFGAVPLSSSSHPILDIASHIVTMLLDRVENRYQGPSRSVVIRGDFHPRQSTAPLP